MGIVWVRSRLSSASMGYPDLSQPVERYGVANVSDALVVQCGLFGALLPHFGLVRRGRFSRMLFLDGIDRAGAGRIGGSGGI